MIVRNLSRGSVLCRRARAADDFATRARGLMGRKEWKEFDGLLLSPCSSIHTCFMRMPIDVCFLDREQRVLRVLGGLGSWRFAFGPRGTRHTLELPSGALQQGATRAGDCLTMEDPANTER